MRAPSPQVLDFLGAEDGPVGNLALALREIVLAEASDAIEKTYPNHPSAVWFGFGPKMGDMFCYIATTRNHVNLGFCRGALLADPDQILEGKGKIMRHVKIWERAELARPFIRKYVRAAVRLEKTRGNV